MIQLGDTIVSFDLFEKKFCCDLAICKGICCVEGDSGAPMEESEVDEIKNNYSAIKKYMTPQGISAVKKEGYGNIDFEGDLVTPLVKKKECAYAINENGNCWCAIEKAWMNKESTFRKPISCHLYPIRIKKYDGFELVNYHKWKICSCARIKGSKENIPVYVFTKDALIRKYGKEWYDELTIIAKQIDNGDIETF